MPKVLPKKHALKKELSVVVVIKALLLYCIWLLCFSHPPSHHINDASFTEHLINSTVVNKEK